MQVNISVFAVWSLCRRPLGSEGDATLKPFKLSYGKKFQEKWKCFTGELVMRLTLALRLLHVVSFATSKTLSDRLASLIDHSWEFIVCAKSLKVEFEKLFFLRNATRITWNNFLSRNWIAIAPFTESGLQFAESNAVNLTFNCHRNRLNFAPENAVSIFVL